MEEMNIAKIPNAISGASFHGETWVKCPHCGQGNEISYATPIYNCDGYAVHKCKCGELFKVEEY